MNKRNTMKQRTPEKSKLEKGLEGRPKITLKQLKETVVNTLTQEAYLNLMRVYECGGWKWLSGNLPTQKNYWSTYKEKTCILVENKFGYENEKYCRESGREVLSTKKFYDKQNITPGNIDKIKNYFETKK